MDGWMGCCRARAVQGLGVCWHARSAQAHSAVQPRDSLAATGLTPVAKMKHQCCGVRSVVYCIAGVTLARSSITVQAGDACVMVNCVCVCNT